MNSESIGNLPWRQRGAALLVTLIILVLLTTAILLDLLNAVATPAPFGDRKSGETLARAKDALIAWAAAHPDHPGLLPFPDRNDDATPNYDGTADCVSAVSLASGDLLGRFPIQGEQTGAGCATDIGMSVTVEDSAGERLGTPYRGTWSAAAAAARSIRTSASLVPIRGLPYATPMAT